MVATKRSVEFAAEFAALSEVVAPPAAAVETHIERLQAALRALILELVFLRAQRFCLSTRMCWSRVYSYALDKGRLPSHLADEFNKCLASGLDAMARVPVPIDPEERALLPKYFDAVRFRRELMHILMEDGVDAVERTFLARIECKGVASACKDIDAETQARS